MVERGIGQNVCEVQAVLSFGPYQRGERALVDLEDPAVAGLVKAGYLQLMEVSGGSTGGVGVGVVPVVGVGAGVEGSPSSEVSDVAGEPESGEGSYDGAETGFAVGAEDN